MLLFVLSFIQLPTFLCESAGKAMARLRGCAGSPKLQCLPVLELPFSHGLDHRGH